MPSFQGNLLVFWSFLECFIPPAPTPQEAIYASWKTRLKGHFAGCCQQRGEQMGDKEVRRKAWSQVS